MTTHDGSSSRHELAEALAEFSQLLHGDHDVADIFDTLGEFCTRLLPIHGVGMLVAREGPFDLIVATASTELGQQIEQLEAELMEGPCHDALRFGHQVAVPDLADVVDRYPRFAPRALDAGLRSIHALPMASQQGAVVASLDIVARDPVVLTETQLATAQLLADVSFSYVVNWSMRQRTTTLTRQLQEALDSRVTIEQAKGVLAERHDEPVDDAFRRLREHARSEGLKLRAVADAVIDGRLAL